MITDSISAISNLKIEELTKPFEDMLLGLTKQKVSIGIQNRGVGGLQFNATEKSYLLLISAQDIIKHSKESGSDIESSFIELMSHEVLHILLGHHSKKHQKLNRELFSICCELEVQNFLKTGPGISAKNYDMSDKLSAEDYYTLIGLRSDQSLFENARVELAGHNSIGSSVLSFKMLVKDQKELRKQFNSSNFSGTFDPFKALKKHNIDDVEDMEIQGLKDVMSFIIQNENSMYMKRVTKKQDWMKFNNRRNTSYQKSQLLLPGKKVVSGGYTRKHSDSSVIFIDISGSLSIYKKELLFICKSLRDMCNINIVFYNYKIQGIVKSDDVLFLPEIRGSTSIVNTILEFNEVKHQHSLGSINRIYVITDGIDDFDYVKKNFDSKIWVISDGLIKSHN